MVTTCFKDVVETDEVALDISIRIGDAVTYTCLSSEIYNNRDIVFGENLFYGFLVGNRGMNKLPYIFFRTRITMNFTRIIMNQILGNSFDFFQTFVLDVDILIIGNGIYADNFDVLYIVEKTLYEVAAYKASGTCHEDSLAFERNVIL